MRRRRFFLALALGACLALLATEDSGCRKKPGAPGSSGPPTAAPHPPSTTRSPDPANAPRQPLLRPTPPG